MPETDCLEPNNLDKKELENVFKFIIKNSSIVTILASIGILMFFNHFFALSFILGSFLFTTSMLLNGFVLTKAIRDGYGKTLIYIVTVVRILVIVLAGFIISTFDYKYLISYIAGGSVIVFVMILYSRKI